MTNKIKIYVILFALLVGLSAPIGPASEVEASSTIKTIVYEVVHNSSSTYQSEYVIGDVKAGDLFTVKYNITTGMVNIDKPFFNMSSRQASMSGWDVSYTHSGELHTFLDGGSYKDVRTDEIVQGPYGTSTYSAKVLTTKGDFLTTPTGKNYFNNVTSSARTQLYTYGKHTIHGVDVHVMYDLVVKSISMSTEGGSTGGACTGPATNDTIRTIVFEVARNNNTPSESSMGYYQADVNAGELFTVKFNMNTGMVNIDKPFLHFSSRTGYADGWDIYYTHSSEIHTMLDGARVKNVTTSANLRDMSGSQYYTAKVPTTGGDFLTTPAGRSFFGNVTTAYRGIMYSYAKMTLHNIDVAIEYDIKIKSISVGQGSSGGGSSNCATPDVVVKCSDGTTARKQADGSYVCPTGTPIISGGGGSLIDIPRYDYNHTSSNTNTEISQETSGGKGLGDIKDDTKEVNLKGSFTNIPASGVVYMTGDGFIPKTHIQYKTDSTIIPSIVGEESNTEQFLKDNKITAYLNTIDLNVFDITDKVVADFKSKYTACPTNPEKGVNCTKVTDSSGVKDLNGFKISKPGRYLLTAYLDNGTETHLTYRIVDVRNGSEFTGLPVPNRLTAMVENKNLKEKKNSTPHAFSDLRFTSSSTKEDSLSVMSINNSLTNRIVLGSTEKGVKMYNSDLTPTSLKGDSLTEASITGVVDVDGTPKVVASSNNKGAYTINTTTGDTAKITDLPSENIQSIAKLSNLYYIAFSDSVSVYFIDENNVAHLRDSISSKEIFGEDVKLGQLTLMGEHIMINTHHESNKRLMAMISKFETGRK